MIKFKKWLHTITFGEKDKFIRLALWNFLDSFAVTIPYGVMFTAIYVFLIPLADSSSPLPVNRLWILCAILLLQLIAYYFIRRKTYIGICTGFADATKNARIFMGEHLRKLPMSFFGRRDAGDLSTVLLRDYVEVEGLASSLIPQISVILVRLTLSIIFLSAFNFRMMLSVIIVIPLSLPFVYMSYKKMGHVSNKLLSAQQTSSSRILEYIGGIKALKAFNMAGSQFEELKESFENQRNHSIGMEIAAAPIGMIGRFIINCGMGIIMLSGILLLTHGELSIFYYISFLLIALNIYEPIMILLGFVTDFSRTNLSVKRIQELEKEPQLYEPLSSLTPKNMDIEFKNVSFSYGNNQVLNNISLLFPEKSITALVGPSGSGKSTITRLAARFWDISDGDITLGGIPIKQIKSSDLMSYISIVFQDVYLFNDTIEANIRMGNPKASMDEVIQAAKAAACHDFISSLPNKYKTIVGEGGSTLSGGEKQRISIARALLKNAPIVLLDEATASLDPENEILIQQAISSLVSEKTVIVIAHRLKSICNADQIIVLDNGTVKECGTHNQLLNKNDLYANLWEEQAKAGNWVLS